jgi:hypothetical protein
MDGRPMIFTRGLTIKIGQSRFSKLKMETVLVVSPHSLGMTEMNGLSTRSATTTRFSSISPAPANSPPNTLEKIYTAVRVGVLILEVIGGNSQYLHHLMERISAVHLQTREDIISERRQMARIRWRERRTAGSR